jgi:Asp-tRNA(Asn)/Glu-tRNA(Gln) amidotransferase C subunit
VALQITAHCLKGALRLRDDAVELRRAAHEVLLDHAPENTAEIFVAATQSC